MMPTGLEFNLSPQRAIRENSPAIPFKCHHFTQGHPSMGAIADFSWLPFQVAMLAPCPFSRQRDWLFLWVK